ncbi:DUF899 domain-containing protein [Evansella halocellulosilytica]|uniref:DUF899 domain-containing protein n=1 Tax=Evansella halocellulosilytica TaxID=2011013 RepID=UPI001C54BE4B|nr:DUF899 domain-containing protein [Evansella halocellulosilytica]
MNKENIHLEKNKLSHPKVVSQEEWFRARKELLIKEKETRRAQDALAAERRRLPMVEIEKDYVFEGPNGNESLINLFDGRRQLIVYHFMMEPGSDHRCPGCSFIVDNIGHLAHLHARDTTLVLVSRAPLSQITPYKQRMGWNVPWYSSYGSDFNYDFGATDESGEQGGVSVFYQNNDHVFHTYHTTGRGTDILFGTYNWLDMTPLGRQEDWEDSPEGWRQTPRYEWWRLHDEYDHSKVTGSCCNSGEANS